MSFIDEVKNVLPNKEEQAKKEKEKLLSQEQALKDSFVKKLKQTIILDAKKGNEHAGIVSGRMIFTQDILTDDSNDGYGWYGTNCPPYLETFIKKQPYGFLKYNTIKYCKLIPSPQIICSYENLATWAKTENVFLSELYLYDKKNNEELKTTVLEFEQAKSHVLGDGVFLRYYHKGGGSPYKESEYYYAVNYRITVKR